ncbi:MAG: aminopeptidase P family protein [Elusimicrobia bacterium]|nr:aminopeptidase P family protein [Elusimicrobiota bacterium]MDE2426394.1 aminopeptidase P family protein [Elusimicrobiota bacterium]
MPRSSAPHREIERKGPAFERRAFLAARDRTWRAVERIAECIHPGMLEEDAYEAALAVLADLGSAKNWHRPWVRFGSNTLKAYGILSDKGKRLGERDIFFVDIGPVWDGYEGDAGATFVTGRDEEMLRCQADVQRIFDAVKSRWLDSRDSGRELYRFAARLAQENGWQLNWRSAGHRLCDFPHALYHKGGLSEVGFAPAPEAWVLEIQIRHPLLSFGAFHEDLLLEDREAAAG